MLFPELAWLGRARSLAIPTTLPLAAALWLGLTSLAPARAQNLVQNPGFETGSLAPWTASSTGGISVSAYEDSSSAHTGLWSAQIAYLTQGPGTGSLSQTLLTTPGQTYTFSFWAQYQDDFALFSSPLQVSWNGTQIAAPTLSSFGGYSQYTYNVTATGTSTPITFSLAVNDGLASWYLDDVRVASSVPGPSGLLVMLLGAVPGVGLLRRRK
jgi:hypothetical protein